MTDSRIDRRGLLARVAGAVAVGLAGCSGPEAYNDTPTAEPTETPTDTRTSTETRTPTAEPTETPTADAPANGSEPVGSDTVAPPGNRTNGDRTRNGSRTRPPANRSGDAAAPNGGTRRDRTGQGGSNRTRPSGNASGPQSRSRNRTGNGTTPRPTPTARPTRIAVRVRYPGDWSGSVSTDVGARSISGTGRETISVEGDPSTVLATVTKRERNRKRLTVEILENGWVVARASTREPRGRVRVVSSI